MLSICVCVLLCCLDRPILRHMFLHTKMHLGVAGRSVTRLWYGLAGTSCSLSVWHNVLRS